MALNLRLSGHTGKHVGFFHSGGRRYVKGWWERQDGSEGGELEIDSHTAEISDFDGCYDLPKYVYEELKTLGIKDVQ